MRSPTNELGATIGTAWIDDARLNPFQLAEGRAPESANEAVVDRATVTDEGWTIGDTFTVLAKTGPVELTLVGEATFGEIEGIPGSTMIATDLSTAQELFGEPGAFDSIVVAKSADVAADELAVRLQSALADDQIEVHHRRGRHRRQAGRPPRGPEVLQHVPPRVRLHLAVRRDVHHLQHVLDRDRPAHP